MARPATLKELVRKNIVIQKATGELVMGKYRVNGYHVFLKPPEEGFYKGASEAEKEFAKKAIAGDIESHEAAHKHLESLGIPSLRPPAECPGRHLGYVVLQQRPNSREAFLYQFYPLAYAKETQRWRGVGGHVIDHILEDLKREGIETVHMVDVRNPDLKAMLRRRGFSFRTTDRLYTGTMRFEK